jgi:hypothetical protein
VQHSTKGEIIMNCSHHMWDDPTGPLCTRSDTHDTNAPGGHVYESRDGSFTNKSELTDGTH